MAERVRWILAIFSRDCVALPAEEIIDASQRWCDPAPKWRQASASVTTSSVVMPSAFLLEPFYRADLLHHAAAAQPCARVGFVPHRLVQAPTESSQIYGHSTAMESGGRERQNSSRGFIVFL